MLGAKVISLYGRDTDLAFGHLGLINIMGWADPERGISGGLITSGKAILYPEVHRFYGVMQRIAAEVPKVRGVGALYLVGSALAIKGETLIRKAYAAFAERDLETPGRDLRRGDRGLDRHRPARRAHRALPRLRRARRVHERPRRPVEAARAPAAALPRRSATAGCSSSAGCAPGTSAASSTPQNAWLWTLRDDRVVSVRVYADPGDARRAFADAG